MDVLISSLAMTQHLGVAVPSFGRHLSQAALTLACLPYEAAFSIDAVVRTVWRLWFTRRRLLEWQPSASVEVAYALPEVRGEIGPHRRAHGQRRIGVDGLRRCLERRVVEQVAG